MEDNGDCRLSEAVRHALLEIWLRSRIQHFAHSRASVTLRATSKAEYKKQMLYNIVSLILLVVGLSIQDQSISDFAGGNATGLLLFFEGLIRFLGQALIILSGIFTIISLYLTVVSDAGESDRVHGRHEFMSQHFHALSQKVRRAESETCDRKYCDYMTIFLNDEIETLYATGVRPGRAEFDYAHGVISDVLKHPDPFVWKSLVPDFLDVRREDLITMLDDTVSSESLR